MKTIDWKAEYKNYSNDNITDVASYVSISGCKMGDGSRINPFPCNVTTAPPANLVLGNGSFEIVHNFNGYTSVTGNSRRDTILKNYTHISNSGQSRHAKYFATLTIKTLRVQGNYSALYYFRDCILDNIVYDLTAPSPFLWYVSNCIYKGSPLFINSTFVSTIKQNTYLDLLLTADSTYHLIRTGQALAIASQVTVNQNVLTNNVSYYAAFNNCSFVIGNESTATPLIGNNANELRSNFVSRCTAQGLTVPNINDFGTNVPAGRWVFSNTSIAGEYDTIQGSEIDQFAKLRGIYFGHSNVAVKQVPITTLQNIPASFTTTPVSNALVQDNSIGLLATSGIAQRVEAYADSKIIWLGGLSKLTTLALTHNLPSEAGVSPDSVFGLAKTNNGSISAGNHYIIRSSDSSMATIKYNNVQYTSSLLTRNNVFMGVAGITSFENVSNNAEIYQVLDFANHQSIQIRLMRELPGGNITTGNLQAGYWYFVEPNNLNDTSGTITYKGIAHPAFDSFWVDDTNLTFTVNGTCHLRRCWKQNFDMSTEITDKAFWKDRQKPNYFDVIPNDLRCLLKNDSSASVELAEGSDGVYIGSGHPEFYNKVNGVTGLPLPSYDIVGSFLQIRVPITTINPM